MQTQKRLQYRVDTELPYRHKKVYGAEEQGISFTISPSLRLSTPDFLGKVCIIGLERRSAQLYNLRSKECYSVQFLRTDNLLIFIK